MLLEEQSSRQEYDGSISDQVFSFQEGKITSSDHEEIYDQLKKIKKGRVCTVPCKFRAVTSI